jgi:hypothetical protein
MKIVVSKRSDDFHACLEGHPELWDCGRTHVEAIGRLILTHRDQFDIEIEDKSLEKS